MDYHQTITSCCGLPCQSQQHVELHLACPQRLRPSSSFFGGEDLLDPRAILGGMIGGEPTAAQLEMLARYDAMLDTSALPANSADGRFDDPEEDGDEDADGSGGGAAGGGVGGAPGAAP